MRQPSSFYYGVLAGCPRPQFQRPLFKCKHTSSLFTDPLFSRRLSRRKILSNICVQATYEPSEVFFISNTLAGKVLFFRFCLLKIYTAVLTYLVPQKQFCFMLNQKMLEKLSPSKEIASKSYDSVQNWEKFYVRVLFKIPPECQFDLLKLNMVPWNLNSRFPYI